MLCDRHKKGESQRLIHHLGSEGYCEQVAITWAHEGHHQQVAIAFTERPPSCPATQRFVPLI